MFTSDKHQNLTTALKPDKKGTAFGVCVCVCVCVNINIYIYIYKCVCVCVCVCVDQPSRFFTTKISFPVFLRSCILRSFHSLLRNFTGRLPIYLPTRVAQFERKAVVSNKLEHANTDARAYGPKLEARIHAPHTNTYTKRGRCKPHRSSPTWL